MALEKCPICGVGVKLENLKRHAANVHPGHEFEALISERERRTLRRSERHTQAGIRVRRSTIVAVAALSLLVVGIAFALPRLPGPSHPGTMAMHWHPRLSVTINGEAVPIPANIGIDPGLWNDHTMDAYGMQAMPEMGMGGMAPLHTHDASGKIHEESTAVRDYTIGDFFRIWGQTFDGQQVLGHPAPAGHRVRMIVDGTGTPPSYSAVLRDGITIEIVCGPG